MSSVCFHNSLIVSWTHVTVCIQPIEIIGPIALRITLSFISLHCKLPKFIYFHKHNTYSYPFMLLFFVAQASCFHLPFVCVTRIAWYTTLFSALFTDVSNSKWREERDGDASDDSCVKSCSCWTVEPLKCRESQWAETFSSCQPQPVLVPCNEDSIKILFK